MTPTHQKASEQIALQIGTLIMQGIGMQAELEQTREALAQAQAKVAELEEAMQEKAQ